MRCVLLALLCVAAVQPFSIERWLEEHSSEVKERGGNIWVLLIAGSSGWYNYRHQADICHIWHTLTKKHGIDQRYVVTMMANDIAYNTENKRQGEIINALKGKNVYNGVVIDYMDSAVTPENFLAILRGDHASVERQGSGKVIQSTSKDVVFVNFADHGDTGVLGFPHGELHKADLIQTLTRMYHMEKYSQMLWYVEACYSGSMFDTLEPGMNITAHTAANDKESSYACTYDDYLDVYLGDCWSLNWMNNTDQIFPNLGSETVGQQYLIVKNMTTKSHAMIYGDLKVIYNEPISKFMGHAGHGVQEEVSGGRIELDDALLSQDTLLYSLRRRLSKSSSDEEASRLQGLIQYHEVTEAAARSAVQQIAGRVAGSRELADILAGNTARVMDPHCNKAVLDTFYRRCWGFQEHPYITKYTPQLARLCNHFRAQDIVIAVQETCRHRA